MHNNFRAIPKEKTITKFILLGRLNKIIVISEAGEWVYRTTVVLK